MREGGRPEVAGWVLPHRQIGGGREGAGEGVKEVRKEVWDLSLSLSPFFERGDGMIVAVAAKLLI